MKKLTTNKQLFLFSLGGVGVYMLNLIMGTYLTNALMAEGIVQNGNQWTYFFNTTIVSTVIWSFLLTLSKLIAGFINLPLSIFADKVKSNYGRRRPFIFFGFLGTIVSFILFLLPLSNEEGHLGNTFWFFFVLVFFYFSYTAMMIAYLASFAEITKDEKDREKVGNYATILKVIYSILGYTLIPVLVYFNISVRMVGTIFLPFALTMLIPLFMIKEKSNLIQDQKYEDVKKNEINISQERLKKSGLRKSMKYALANKGFVIWLIIFACIEVAIQLIAVSEIVILLGLMFEGYHIAIIACCIFLPIPLTINIYKVLVRRFGFKIGFINSLLLFLTAIIIYNGVVYIDSFDTRFILMIVAGIISSAGFGAFFSAGYVVPSVLAKIEYDRTGISHQAMFLTLEGIVAGTFSAVATGIVWVNMRAAGLSSYVPMIILGLTIVALALAFFLPSEIKEYSKKTDLNDV